MKQRSTTPLSRRFVTKSLIVVVSLVAVTAVPLQILGSQPAHAVDYEAQKAAIRKQINGYESEAGQLSQQADTLQNKLSVLANEKATIQAQIDLSQTQYDKLKKEIKQNEEKIAENKVALGETIATMYVDDSISPLEMLASSSSIGDYVDKQEYRSTVRDNLNKTIKDIKILKKKLEEQKLAVERELKNQQNQRDLLAQKEAEQDKLLKETRGKEANYRKIADEKRAQLSAVQAAQARANCQASGGNWSDGSCVFPVSAGGGAMNGTPGGGGYPGMWAIAPMNAYVDDWGLYSRQCVSYTAWKVASTGRFVPHFGGMGNANQWPSTVAAYGIGSGSTPKAGSVAMMNVGVYGHTMYVESVNGDGTITVSDYNLAWDGLYRNYTRSASGLTYIYF